MSLQRRRLPRWSRFAAIVVAIVATSLCRADRSGFSTVLGSPGTEYANAVASDGAGNTSQPGTSAFLEDHTAPTAPTISLKHDAADDTGVSATDGLTNDPTLAITSAPGRDSACR